MNAVTLMSPTVPTIIIPRTVPPSPSSSSQSQPKPSEHKLLSGDGDDDQIQIAAMEHTVNVNVNQNKDKDEQRDDQFAKKDATENNSNDDNKHSEEILNYIYNIQTQTNLNDHNEESEQIQYKKWQQTLFEQEQTLQKRAVEESAKVHSYSDANCIK